MTPGRRPRVLSTNHRSLRRGSNDGGPRRLTPHGHSSTAHRHSTTSLPCFREEVWNDRAPPQDLLTSQTAARNGSKNALGDLLENYRNCLLLIAQQEIDPRLLTKGGASDLVQETFLEAQRDFAGFQGDSKEELLAWLRQLLRNNLANFARRYRNTRKPDQTRDAPGGRWLRPVAARLAACRRPFPQRTDDR